MSEVPATAASPPPPDPPPPAGPSPRSAPPGASATADVNPATVPTSPARRRWVWALAGGVVVVLVLAAAGVFTSSGTHATGAATKVGTANGYAEFADHADGFSIAVPSAWRQVDPSSPGAAAAFQQIEAANPGLQRVFGSGFAGLVAQGIKFLAVDPQAGVGGNPTVNVVVRSAPGATDAGLAQLADGIRSEYGQIGAEVLGTTTVRVAGHRALEVRADFALSGEDGTSATVHETQYFVAASGFVYIVSLAGSSPQFATVVSTFAVR